MLIIAQCITKTANSGGLNYVQLPILQAKDQFHLINAQKDFQIFLRLILFEQIKSERKLILLHTTPGTHLKEFTTAISDNLYSKLFCLSRKSVYNYEQKV